MHCIFCKSPEHNFPFSAGVAILVDLLSNSSDNVVAMSADIISDIAASRRARKLLQANGGLIILVKQSMCSFLLNFLPRRTGFGIY